VLLHHEILTKIWGPEYRDETGYLRAYVRNLRRKIEPDPANPKILLSSTGIGYYVASPDEAQDV
jgi:two-component system KDP operon response regulator KdpE